ncbi:GNAT family N-acetyltransferase [Vibrio porteresiae]|uniref:GNAT family N-acetyltransferase n=1 Tax=Vibrio porteresiae DSM 19223 TaxID=1123496 RepID=A0ABZ0Q7U3_9VIBR|nr:GNAT family N-acetyltransferase [Vibrio porteresiae]WPC72494.1 GNAT family N-acetyltransferase [Vibrio porteresiae DSM 19223]
MSQIDFKSARAQHLEQLNELMFALHDEHHQACPDHFKTAEEIEQEKSIARYLDDPECLVYVALADETVIGFATGHFCELVSTVSKPVLMGSIDELYVVPKYRSKGVASRLCARLEQTMREYGVTQLFVEVWDFNTGAQDFYQDMGFGHHIHWLRKSIK